MREMRNGVIVEKTEQGCRVEGYLNDDRLVTISNFSLSRRFLISQSKTLAGDIDQALAINAVMSAALETVESLRAECEGRVAIGVVKRDDGWVVTTDGFDIHKEEKREDAIGMAEHFKLSYERAGTVVSYSLEE
ncbi:hypothetical protein [Serratia sp. Se-RSBMAAmG]|uniref:hypothetical protein n=1 Tax=Serratia sp. Se-RSBMAAmG TaxID=3043305 RepID=UPI0024AFC48A|nr:hypothetical protein [Serratia sp. Se-RSBMAAmG]MDI6976554.1 hypothetical protein [Serratia sp. Se-RSBMAAmG]